MRGFCILFLASFLFVTVSAAASENWKQKSENPEFIHRSIKQVTDVMVHDIYSPPVASRIYAYVTIAGYEAAIQGNRKYISLAGQLHGLTPVPTPKADKEYSSSLASVHAILTVGKALVISEAKIDGFHKKVLLEFKKAGMPEEVFKNSVSYGQKVADHILSWASKDNYK